MSLCLYLQFLEQKIAIAPFLIASSINFSPLKFLPFIAKKRYPFLIFLLLFEIPEIFNFFFFYW